MKEETLRLVPANKAAEEFGVHRQTISNWMDEGLLQGTFIKGNRFISRESMDRLKELYPQAGKDAAGIERYREDIAALEGELKEQCNALRLERFYRGYVPRYIRNFIENATDLIRALDKDKWDDALDRDFLHCWLFGHDIQQTCEEKNVSYFRYMSSAKRFANIVRDMSDYTSLCRRNHELETEMDAMRKEMQQLQSDMDTYRSRYERVDNEQTWKEKYPILIVPINELDFTVRTLNVLKMHGFDTLAQVIKYSPQQLLKMRLFGKKSIYEIADFLEPYGLELSTDLDITPGKKNKP